MSSSATTALLFLVALAASPAHLSLLPVTQELFGTQAQGAVAAFGDFNADKQTDIFVVREKNKLIIFLADQKAPYFKPKVQLQLEGNIEITSVVPGDYNGDSQMDVLLTTAPENQPKSDINLSAVIFWGHNQTLNDNNKTNLNETFSDEPLIMDYNGDLIPDIFYTTRESKQPHILIGGNLKLNYTLSSQNEMYVPHSHAFIDLNGDLAADLFLTTRSGNDIQFETWINMDGNYVNCTWLMQKPKNALIIGQSVFADFDGDGRQDHLVPTCEDEKCLKSAIYLIKPNSSEWTNILPDFNNKDTLWGFVSGENTPPITLHIGDYNMDGFPDALAILKNTSGSNQQAFLLENVACHNASCKSVGRMFNVYWEPSELKQIKDATVAAFFDIYEDGILDIIVLSKGSQSNDFTISAFKNNFEADAYFVKVIVLSGLCSNNCPDHAKPFGVNQPGPYIMYTTVDSNGLSKNASAGQLSQSAHSALQLPYNVLGLGRSANFLDHLIVGIPRAKGDSDTRSQEWTAIIPNSQLIVIPYQPNVPRSWSAKLYLTPSNIVMLTAIALIGVCVFILTIIGILHWQEKKADDREKRQEAHRFHFDAM